MRFETHPRPQDIAPPKGADSPVLTPAASPSKPQSDTRAAPFLGVLLVIIASLLMIAFGVLFPPLLILGAVCLLLAIPIGVFTRKGSCPNCQARIICVGGTARQRCRDCKHRLVLRSGKLIDVT
jgi:hypothetical protein